MKITIALILFFIPFNSQAEFSGQIHTDSIQYAQDAKPVTQIQAEFNWKKDRNIEFHLRSWTESGSLGDKSFDLDPAVLRWFSSASHLWIGRTHPILETGLTSTQSTSLLATDAIGTLWVQNQSDALSPRVSGWIGAGGSISILNDRIFFTGAYSPIFLPSSGSRLTLSKTNAATGSRFARIPPQFVRINESTVLPLRYELAPVDIKEVMLQNQIFGSIAYLSPIGKWEGLAWTAPNPNPELDLSSTVRVSRENADVLVVPHAHFLRHGFYGLRWSFENMLDAEAIHDWTIPSTTLSARLALGLTTSLFLQTGCLQELRDKQSEMIQSASYSDQLYWLQLRHLFFNARLTAELRWEQHLKTSASGSWLKPTLTYETFKNLWIVATASLLTGEDHSYFGTWRHLDSTQVGVLFLW